MGTDAKWTCNLSKCKYQVTSKCNSVDKCWNSLQLSGYRLFCNRVILPVG